MALLPKIQEINNRIEAGAKLDDLVTEGYSVDDIMAAVRLRKYVANRAKILTVPKPTPMGALLWARRKEYLLDNQPVYGDFKEYYLEMLTALNADDQDQYSRSRDLLFKAMRTIWGDPEPEPTPVVEIPTPSQPAPAAFPGTLQSKGTSTNQPPQLPPDISLPKV